MNLIHLFVWLSLSYIVNNLHEHGLLVDNHLIPQAIILVSIVRGLYLLFQTNSYLDLPDPTVVIHADKDDEQQVMSSRLLIMTEFMKAADRGDMETIHHYLEKDQGLASFAYADGQSALSIALVADQIEVVKHLLKFPGAALLLNRRLTGCNGMTPVHLQVYMADNPDLLRLLLESGGDPNVVDRKNQPMLLMASNGVLVEQDLITCRILLEHGANPFSCAMDGEGIQFSALDLATDNSVIKLILAYQWKHIAHERGLIRFLNHIYDHQNSALLDPFWSILLPIYIKLIIIQSNPHINFRNYS